MIKFRTEIKVKQADVKITHYTPVLFIGSCFSENIGRWLEELKFDVAVNPYGITFNPMSIVQQLQHLRNKTLPKESELIEHRGIFSSYDFHSKFSEDDKEVALQKMKRAVSEAARSISKTKVLVITFGSSYAYKLKSTGKIVNNCHKVPGTSFEKILIESTQQVSALREHLQALLEENPELNIVFTVSPVRHWKDGALENQLSKSHLLISCHSLCAEFDRCHYFPAYEIMMDELRDYRFYAEDMLHPSSIAINYIREKFSSAFFNAETNALVEKIEEINRALAHRPRNKNSVEHRDFIENCKRKIENLEGEVQMRFNKETAARSDFE